MPSSTSPSEPLPPVGLVGVVQADSGLHLPDFRAAERTHQLLVDAVNLARPASAGGRVIVQTMLPMHHVMQAVIAHDPARFYSEEMEARRLLGYPPAQHLIYLTVSGKDRRETESAAQRWVNELHKTLSAHTADTLPAAASLRQKLSVNQPSAGMSVLGPVAAVGVGLVGRVAYQRRGIGTRLVEQPVLDLPRRDLLRRRPHGRGAARNSPCSGRPTAIASR